MANRINNRAAQQTTQQREQREQRGATAAALVADPVDVATGGALDTMAPRRAGRAVLNPAVDAATQRATWERTFALGRRLVSEGKVPVIFIDHRLTGLDDRPIIKAGLQELARASAIPELLDVDAALQNGTLKSLPGYTTEASDHWRDQHPQLVAAHAALSVRGERLPINFMGASPIAADATAGLSELVARWTLETGGAGEIVFGGSGTGTLDDFKSVYTRAKSKGGGGLVNPDVRFGAPSVSAAARARADVLARNYNAAHPNDAPVLLDHDSDGKAGFIELIERERGADNKPKIVAAFMDDRAHNRFAAKAASTLRDEMIDIKAVAPGLSFSQLDNANINQSSTFHPAP